MSPFPAYQDAKDDRSLRGNPLVVYLHLLDELSPVEWIEVKQFALCVRLGISARGMRYALNLLVSRGYIERKRVRAGAVRLYRLVYNRVP